MINESFQKTFQKHPPYRTDSKRMLMLVEHLVTGSLEHVFECTGHPISSSLPEIYILMDSPFIYGHNPRPGPVLIFPLWELSKCPQKVKVIFFLVFITYIFHLHNVIITAHIHRHTHARTHTYTHSQFGDNNLLKTHFLGGNQSSRRKPMQT